MSERMSILVVDDERIVRESFQHWFAKYGYRVAVVASGLEALERLEGEPFDLMFVDIKMPGMDGLELLGKVKEKYPEVLVVIITAYGSIESAVQAMKLGASDYLLKPFQPEQLTLVLEKVVRQKRLVSKYQYVKGRLDEVTRFDNIIGQSGAMQEVFDLITQVAQSDSPVLIVGETGTGKELVAKAIHAKSKRSSRPFIAINCGAIPDALLESELFGHQKGAFTGADHPRKGFFEVVSGGTLFLDEIGEVSAKMQVDLLRVLEEKQILKIGDRAPIPVDFRLISASQRDLRKGADQGSFREDLFYRIHVITIYVPPLRERKDDLPLLVEHFLGKFSHQTTKRVDHVDAEGMAFLRSYDWPGNVRELQNAIERAVVLSKKRVLHAEDFAFLHPSPSTPFTPRSLRELQREHVRRVLEECKWNVTQASEVLDVHRTTLHKMIQRHGLRKP